MSRIMFSAEERHEEAIERVKSEEDLDSTSAAVRECIDRMIEMQQREEELQQRVDKRVEELQQRAAEREAELQQRIDRLETENERLNAEKRQILAQREEHTELVRTVERQQSLAERKAHAGLLTKTKWVLFGMPDNESDVV